MRDIRRTVTTTQNKRDQEMRSETPAQLHLKVGPSVVTDSLILRGDGYRTMKVAGAAAAADKRQAAA